MSSQNFTNPTDPANNKQPGQSTGPITPEGKAASSKNALKHGSCSTSTLILLERESIDDFLALEKRWFQGYRINAENPATQLEAELIRAAARAEWFYLRSERNYAEAEANIIDTMPNPLGWGPEQHNSLQRFLRYRTANQNILIRARKALEDYRKNRAQEAARAQAAEHKDEKQAMDKERRAIHRKKHQPEPTVDELVEQMKQQAIRQGYRTPDGKPTGKV
jgi:hypothetical protein